MKKILLLGILALFFISSASALLHTQDFSSYYQFENNLSDTSGNSSTLTAGTGNSFSSSIFKLGAYSRQFTGVGSDTATNDSYNFTTGQFTIALWINTSATNSPVVKTGNSFDSYIELGAWAVVIKSGAIRFERTSTLIASGTAASISDKNWHRIIITRNITNGITIYYDGNAVGYGNDNTDFYSTGLAVGGAAAYNYYVGYVDDLILQKGYSWTQTDVNNDYNTGLGFSYTQSSGNSLTVSLNSPQNGTTLTSIGTNFNASYIVSNINMTNATYYIWNSNGSLFNQTTRTITGNSSNSSSLFIDSFSLDNYYWNVNLCGINTTTTVCSFGAANYSYSVGAIVNSQSYVNGTFETATSNFNISIGLLQGSQLSLAKLVYNGVNYTISNVVIYPNGTGVLSIPIDLPLNTQPTSQLNNFHYEFTYNGGQIQVLPNQQQNVSTINLSICGTRARALNLTFYDEGTQTVLNSATNPTNIQTAFMYWLGTGSIMKNYSFSNLTSTTNSYSFCISSNQTIYVNMDSTFSATNYNFNDYALRNSTLTNVSTTIPLYILATASDATKFYDTVQQGATFVNGALVTVSKFFTGSGQWITTATKITDDDGKFPMWMDLDADYQFTVVKNGVLMGTVTKSAACASAPCSLNLKLTSSTGSAYDAYSNQYAGLLTSNITFNVTSKVVSYSFIDLTGLAHYLRLEVDGYNFQNDSIVLCNNYAYSSSGTITCDLSNYTGNFLAQGFISRSPEKADPSAIFSGVIDDNAIANVGLDGLWMVMGLIITIVFGAAVMSKGNPTVVIFAFGIVLLMLKVIGILPFSWIVVVTVEAVIFYIITKLKV